MKRLLTLLSASITITTFAQENPTQQAQPIVVEGKMLYRSEMASWYGTDLFLEKYKNRENVGGYLSYSERDSSKAIFFSKGASPKVIGTITFDSTYSINTATTSLEEREFTRIERDLYQIRTLALAEINADTLFKHYAKMNFNLIPLINGKEKKVYVLTGPTENGVVIIGNDYLLTFDESNKLLAKRQLHKNIIPIYFGRKEDEGVIGAMHSHLPETGEFITATDICTLMLYERFAKWKTHEVVSEKYLNIWNCETDQLTVIPRDAVEKINKDQKRKNK